MSVQKVVGERNLYVNRRIRFTPVRNYVKVTDSRGRVIIAAQTQYEFYKSKLINMRRAAKRRGLSDREGSL